MGTALGRVFAMLLLFYAAAFALFFGWTLFFAPKADLLASFTTGFAWGNALRLLLENAVAVQASAVVVAFSLRFGRKAAAGPGQGAPFSKFVGSTVLAFILLAAVYTVLSEGVLPGVRSRIAEMRHLTSLARQYGDLARESMKKDDGRAALEFWTQYLAIDKDDAAAVEGKLAAEDLAARQENAREAAARDNGKAPLEKEAEPDAEALLRKARAYFDAEDWFSAHYYASRAYAADRTRMDAKRLADDAWRMVGDVKRTAKADAAAQELYAAKKAAYGFLAGGQYVDAYYAYLEISRSHPADREVQDQLAQSRAGMASTVFYLDGADRAASMPATRGILFRNTEGDGAAEAVSIGRMAELPEATYLFDVEAVRYGADGAVAWHLKADRGMILGDGRRVLLHGADRDRRREEKPVYLAGARPAGERDYLDLHRSIEELRAQGAGRLDLSTLGLAALWTRRAEIVSSGARDEDVSLEIAMKAMGPFLFLVFSLFAVSLGWAYRSRYLGKPPLAVLLLVPLVPLTVSLAAMLYAYAHRILLGFAVLSLGLMGALGVLAAMELALLLAAIVLLAGQAAQ